MVTRKKFIFPIIQAVAVAVAVAHLVAVQFNKVLHDVNICLIEQFTQIHFTYVFLNKRSFFYWIVKDFTLKLIL